MLPVDAVLPALLDALSARREALLVAPPGAGKTTRTPLALLDAEWAARGRLLVLSPRRIAARAAAARMAHTLGERVGETVGYRVRLDSQVSARTRIEVVTEGVFTRRILDDPSLDGVSAVLFDEFHERSLDADLGLALAREAQQALRPDLRLVVMSATLDVARIAALLNDAPVVRSEGRAYPVELRYRPRNARLRLEEDMAAAIREALAAEAGDVLAFLPGAREIQRTAERLEESVRDAKVDVRPLYGAMSSEAQDAAIAPSPEGRRKVVLATSIAETSLTIEGVRIVVDSGLARRPRFEPGLGLARLETARASLAAVSQRAGRAGRTQPGTAWRLWDEGETRALAPFDRPEILDADLCGLALDLAAWGARDPEAMVWLDPPPKPAWEEAIKGLKRIGALDEDGAITAHGRALSALPLPPRLAHMIMRAAESGDGVLAAHLAVLLTERGLGGDDADLRIRLRRWASSRDRRSEAARGLASRLARSAGARGAMAFERAGRVLARGFPERVAKARDGRAVFLMANGRAASVDETDALAGEAFLVIADASGRADRTQILSAAPLQAADLEELFADEIEMRARVFLDADSGAVRGRRLRRLGAITLSEAPLETLASEEIEAALIEHVRTRGLEALPWDENAEQMLARMRFLRARLGTAWPDWSEAALVERLQDWLPVSGARKLSDLAGKLAAALAGMLSYEQRRAFEETAPARLETPAGGSHRIDYAAQGGPAVDVRLQEMFGVAEHPKVAGVPLVLRLTSPAGRPVQTTADLPGFWRGAYGAVRADMRGRYPKHPWPEDPLNAAPTRRAKPRGS